MKLLQLITLSIFTLFLTACGSSSSNDEATNPAPGTVLSTRTLFTPEHGAQAISKNAIELSENKKIINQDSFTNTLTYSKVDELPNKFGYQHPQSGPFIKTELKQSGGKNNNGHLNTSYLTNSNATVLLISHRINDRTYSTIEFKEVEEESTDVSNLELTANETITSTVKQKLFHISSGNEVGFLKSKIIMKVLRQEKITLSFGPIVTVKAEYDAETSQNIFGFSSKSWTQKLKGSAWFDQATGEMVKMDIAGTFERKDLLNRVINIKNSFELIQSINPASKLYSTPKKSLPTSVSMAALQATSTEVSELLIKNVNQIITQPL